ncbi:methyltransferase domain-containing protein [Streptomyces sp. NPDC050085]|uniref:class I SAM-dependent methyltransferase n=1 Tax=Streptomyces sp. NPDC050085 TaxID=3365600 RepID=UPI0037A5D8FE
MTSYLFDNTATQAPDRFTVLETCYDPVSRHHLGQAGLRPGLRCLEVGGGGGSLGTWLADAVGPEGRVLVTDLVPPPPDIARPRPQLDRVRHDIVHDPLPDAAFDLIHARLVLLHLPERIDVLDRLMAALRPGGHLVLEEFDCGWTPVLRTPGPDAADLFEHIHGHVLDLLREAGADPLWGRHVYGAMARAGFVGLTATTHAEAWPGGDIGTRLHRANTQQCEEKLLARGVTADELRAFWTLLDNPGFTVNSYPLVSVCGRKP